MRRERTVGWIAAIAALAATGAAMLPLGPSSVSAAGPEADKNSAVALARSELLPSSVYPKGWRGYGQGTAIHQLSFFAGYEGNNASLLAACLGIPTTSIETNPVEAAGPRYNGKNSALAASDNVEVFRTVEDAVTDVEAAGNPKAGSCNKHLPGPSSGTTYYDGLKMIISSPVFLQGPINGYGDHDANLELIANETFPKYHTTIKMNANLVFVQRGHSESVLYLSNENAPVPFTLVDDLASAAARRMSSS